MRSPPAPQPDELSEETLLAYLEGDGTPEERAGFEAYLDRHPLSKARFEILSAALAEEDGTSSDGSGS